MLPAVWDKMRSPFIPVYTGNTGMVIFALIFIAVYPCVYREHILVISIASLGCRLSLCIQGTPIDLPIIAVGMPFIPVYTGNTDNHRSPKKGFTVYPCVYREHPYYNPLFIN